MIRSAAVTSNPIKTAVNVIIIFYKHKWLQDNGSQHQAVHTGTGDMSLPDPMSTVNLSWPRASNNL
jgi:hypothetical protein